MGSSEPVEVLGLFGRKTINLGCWKGWEYSERLRKAYSAQVANHSEETLGLKQPLTAGCQCNRNMSFCFRRVSQLP